MGLDDFKTTSSSSTTGTTSSSSSTSDVDTSEPDEITPWFCAVIKEEDEVVETYFKKQAFHRGGRHLDEVFLGCIETEDEFERLNEVCEDLHGCNIDELFKKEPFKASDFLDRLTANNDDKKEIKCQVCGDTLIVTEDTYTRVDGKTVCADHKVKEVAQELNLTQ